MTKLEKVREFHRVFNSRIGQMSDITEMERGEWMDLVRLRYALINDELSELEEAMDQRNVVEIADALADLLYVVYGAAVAFGIPIDAVFDEVHDSNMSKLGEDGKPIHRPDGKVMKGPNFRLPDIRKVLRLEEKDGDSSV